MVEHSSIFCGKVGCWSNLLLAQHAIIGAETEQHQINQSISQSIVRSCIEVKAPIASDPPLSYRTVHELMGVQFWEQQTASAICNLEDIRMVFYSYMLLLYDRSSTCTMRRYIMS